MMERNVYGLELLNIQSKDEVWKQKIEHYENIEKLFANYNLKNGYIVVYLNYEVKIGILEDGKMRFYRDEIFDSKYILKLRVFNEREELLIWKENGNYYNVRYRVDGKGENVKTIEADQVLWGTKSMPLGQEWVKLYESRGTELILSRPQKALAKDGDNWMKIKTRNYIGFDVLGQAGYVDSRFVSFV